MSEADPNTPVPTRQRILDAATILFRERGFQATGIDEIGAAAGVTGPALYRHFKGKEDLLLACLQQRPGVSGPVIAAAAELEPGPALDLLVHWYVDAALSDQHALGVYFQEQRYLPEGPRRAIRREMRHFVESWVDPLTQLRPELTPADAWAVVHATIGLVNSVAHYHSGLPHERLRLLLSRMATAALQADFESDADDTFPSLSPHA